MVLYLFFTLFLELNLLLENNSEWLEWWRRSYIFVIHHTYWSRQPAVQVQYWWSLGHTSVLKPLGIRYFSEFSRLKVVWFPQYSLKMIALTKTWLKSHCYWIYLFTYLKHRWRRGLCLNHLAMPSAASNQIPRSTFTVKLWCKQRSIFPAFFVHVFLVALFKRMGKLQQ